MMMYIHFIVVRKYLEIQPVVCYSISDKNKTGWRYNKKCFEIDPNKTQNFYQSNERDSHATFSSCSLRQDRPIFNLIFFKSRFSGNAEGTK